MTGERAIALLRGVNVGGRHRLAMADLRSALGDAGFTGVQTYIQSGNLLFDRPDGTDDESITAAVRAVLASHPDAGGDIPPKWLHVVLFDRPPTTVGRPDAAAFAPDRWVLGQREAYVTYPAGSGRSKLTLEVFERAFGVTATARNLATMVKIVALGRAGG
jgi:uncharacterized protein (DUF1697 family)